MVKAFFYGVILAFGLIVPLGVQNIFVFNLGFYIGWQLLIELIGVVE